MTTIVTRAGKGSALTHNEVDSNFTNLNSAKYESGNNATFGTVGATTITGTSFSNSGNLTFTGTGNRITGDFSNGTVANRVAFQTSTTNGNTVVHALPNGTSAGAFFEANNANDATNASHLQIGMDGITSARISSAIRGTGTFLPMTFNAGGSERMRIDTSGNVGIGTSSPQSLLFLGSGNETLAQATYKGQLTLNGFSGTLNASNLGIEYKVRADGNGYGWRTAAYNESSSVDYVFQSRQNSANWTEVMRLTGAGNVGIGTSSPSAKLTVGGTLRVDGARTSLFANSEPYALQLNYSTASANGPFLGSPSADTFVVSNSGGTERMRIDSSGNVGIGTSSPATRLHVAGPSGFGGFAGAGAAAFISSTATGNSATTLSFGTGSGDLFDISLFAAGATPANAVSINNRNNAPMFFLTNNTERMRIDSSGNLLVNTTDTSLFDNTSGYGVCYRVNASLDVLSTSDNCLILNRTVADGSIAEFRKSGTQVGQIVVSGTATAYNTSSDYRLKENIAQMTGALDVVAQLKPVTYTWKADGSDGQGFIAHELAEVVPDAVTGEKDAVDAEGNPQYQGVDTSFLVATLTAAIQELKAELDIVKAELNTLKGN